MSYNLVAENNQSTVVAEYTPVYERAKSYQSEAELEKALIQQLAEQAYDCLAVKNEDQLVQNLREQLEKLNDYRFTENEWQHFFTGEIANTNQSVADKTATIQEDYIKNLVRDDGTVKNIYLIRKDNIHENCLQVINQYATDAGRRANRYDVTILVNGLPFKVDYVSTMREMEDIEDKQVRDIDREAALLSPERLANIVRYIREHFDNKTRRTDESYTLSVTRNIGDIVTAKDRAKVERIMEKTRLKGFNSIFAVSSIEAAKKYYAEFRRQLAGEPPDRQLSIALIYSFGVNEPDADGMIDENPEDTSGLDQSSRDFLESAIRDYNTLFATSYDTSSDKFQNYYKDVSERVKNRELDLLIVVNMFLTGFDATTLNTLWVDKNLRLHGLLQAFSRTNRILNTIKAFGNIVCFRNLEKATNEAIALFGDKEAGGVVLMKTFDEYYNGYTEGGKTVRGYASLVGELLDTYPVGERILGEKNQKQFIRLYGSLLRLRNILVTFDEFFGKEILSAREMQDYHSTYLDLYSKFRKPGNAEKENINDDIVFEMELIKQIEINIDYILELVKKYHEKNGEDREILVDINKAINSSMELRNKKDLILQFISNLDVHSVVDEDWQRYVEQKRIEELNSIIEQENLNSEETWTFMRNAFRNGTVTATGTDLASVLPPVSRFSPDGERSKKRDSVLERLTTYFTRFFDISRGEL